MIYLYKDLEKKGLSDYQIKKLVSDNQLHMIKKGVYSDKEDYNYLEYISKKHPNAILTLQTACYCYGLINEAIIPYTVATKQKDRKIIDDQIKQIFMTDSLYEIGMKNVKYLGFNVKIYDLERLLIEIVRNKKNIDFDIYFMIIKGYQKISKLLNTNKINEYLLHFKDPKIEYRIKKEIFKCI
ncbi:MAG: type IV toxin-antitoxin system AbiEi family antitoxin domain-containing protein [Bacilli bacterium]|nr:type IV toxin-antitoxin system AbiEi family antitoxin domain-containing protein [Bacilli bacterium]